MQRPVPAGQLLPASESIGQESKSLPSTPVERVPSTGDQDAFPLSTRSYLQTVSAQKAQAAWDKVKDIVHTRRPSSPALDASQKRRPVSSAPRQTPTAASDVTRQTKPEQQRRRNSTGSRENIEVITLSRGHEAQEGYDDPWIEIRSQQSRARQSIDAKSASSKKFATGNWLDPSSSEPGKASSLSPHPDDRQSTAAAGDAEPGEGSYRGGGGGGSGGGKQRKRFSVSHNHHRFSTSVSRTSAAAVLSNSPLDLAGILGEFLYDRLSFDRLSL